MGDLVGSPCVAPLLSFLGVFFNKHLQTSIISPMVNVGCGRTKGKEKAYKKPFGSPLAENYKKPMSVRPSGT